MTTTLPKTLTVDAVRRYARAQSLHRFVKGAWHLVEPDQAFRDNWHVHALCGLLEDVTRGEIKRLLINIPPGTAKSLIVSVFWPAWVWVNNPAKRFLTASYAQELSNRDAEKHRDIVVSDWYRSQWPTVQLKAGSNAKTAFNTTARGWRLATSVGGRGTGLHPDFIVIDDPHKVADTDDGGGIVANAGALRKKAISWFSKTISTRGASRGAAIVIIMQRLHQDDLSGHVLTAPDALSWVHVCLPMRAEPLERMPETKATRWKGDPRQPGELLWPALFPEDKVAQLERVLTPTPAAGQLQQRPTPEGGALFKVGRFKVIPELPRDVVAWCRFWDAAGTEGAGDWTAGALVGKRAAGTFVVADMARGQWSTGVVDNKIQQQAYIDGPKVRVREEQEPGSSGKAVVESRKRLLAGYDYHGVRSTGDKTTRAKPLANQVEAGNVELVAGPWVQRFLDECEVFPFGTNDDQVDAATGGFNELALRGGGYVAGVPAR
jgi:predicted phage terminase large subunit-like protein